MLMSRRRFALLNAAALVTLRGAMPAMAQVAGITASADTTRTIGHARRETEIPANPQRIVTLHNVFAEALIAMGLSPLWQRLPAVAAGHVYPVNIEPWSQSVGPISFAVIIDDVSKALLP